MFADYANSKIDQWHAVRKYMLHDYQKCNLVKSKRFLVIIRKPLQLLMLYSNVKLKIKNQRFLNYQNQIVLFNFKIVPVLKSIQETIDPRKNCFRTMVTLTDFFPRSMLRMFYKAVSSNKSNFESFFRGGVLTYCMLNRKHKVRFKQI